MKLITIEINNREYYYIKGRYNTLTLTNNIKYATSFNDEEVFVVLNKIRNNTFNSPNEFKMSYIEDNSSNVDYNINYNFIENEKKDLEELDEYLTFSILNKNNDEYYTIKMLDESAFILNTDISGTDLFVLSTTSAKKVVDLLINNFKFKEDEISIESKNYSFDVQDLKQNKTINLIKKYNKENEEIENERKNYILKLKNRNILVREEDDIEEEDYGEYYDDFQGQLYSTKIEDISNFENKYIDNKSNFSLLQIDKTTKDVILYNCSLYNIDKKDKKIYFQYDNTIELTQEEIKLYKEKYL